MPHVGLLNVIEEYITESLARYIRLGRVKDGRVLFFVHTINKGNISEKTEG